jgi:hypothetical protein
MINLESQTMQNAKQEISMLEILIENYGEILAVNAASGTLHFNIQVYT